MGGRNGKERHILDNTAWLRNVIQQDPKLKKSVNTFESFTIEPFFCQTARASSSEECPSINHEPTTDINDNQTKSDMHQNDNIQNESIQSDEKRRIVISKIHNINCLSNLLHGKENIKSIKNNEEYSANDNLETMLDKQKIKHFNVTICYRTRKNRVQKIHWVIKTSSCENKNSVHYLASKASVNSLIREINVYKVLISELSNFLAEQSKHPQAKYLLNLPSFIHAEKKELQNVKNGKSNGSIIRHDYEHCYLVLENIISTKQCYPVSNEQIVSGLSLSHFKVFLATLAQVHGVGLSWKIMNNETYLGMKDIHMFNEVQHESLSNKNDEEVEKYLKMYEKLLKWYFDSNDDVRQIKLFNELKTNYQNNQSAQSGFDSELTGLCLGKLTALGINYQYEYPFNETNIIDALESPADVKSSRTNDSIPVCAAINEVHLFHFGDIFKDLAYMFYSLPNSVCREHYMVPLLELYCDVLRQTFEMLDLDWKTIFRGFNRNRIFQQFYHHVPNAIIDAIIVQMKYTDTKELHDICTNKTSSEMMKDIDDVNDICIDEETIPSKYIPLSNIRLNFLISLLDLTYKPF